MSINSNGPIEDKIFIHKASDVSKNTIRNLKNEAEDISSFSDHSDSVSSSTLTNQISIYIHR